MSAYSETNLSDSRLQAIKLQRYLTSQIRQHFKHSSFIC